MRPIDKPKRTLLLGALRFDAALFSQRKCFPWTVKDIASELGLDESTIRKQLKRLIQDGLVVEYSYVGTVAHTNRPQGAVQKLLGYLDAVHGAHDIARYLATLNAVTNTGFLFGRLRVEKAYVENGVPMYNVVCSCGTVLQLKTKTLHSGLKQSCGCLRKDTVAAMSRTHGLSGTPTHKSWLGMRSRVRQTNRPQNKCYIGVTICPEWSEFAVFLRDMGHAPDGYSLDRIDNTQGYFKANCRWVSLSEQAVNTRRVIRVGASYMSAEARKAGLDPDLVSERVNKLGWTMERALTTPKRSIRKRGTKQ